MTKIDKRLDAIKANFGADIQSYVLNKNRGGSSGRKGARYEDYFSAYKVAEAVTACATQGGSWPKVTAQQIAFVDDVIVESQNDTHYHQLKNSSAVSWDAGEHSLRDDFAMQYHLSMSLNEPNPTTNLVVADCVLADKLRAAIPQDIAEHTTVVHFPYAETPNRLLLDNSAVAQVFAQLSRSSPPTDDEIEGVLGVLLMGLMNFPQGATVDQILLSASRCVPNMLCAWNVVDTLQYVDPAFQGVLDAIVGLQYSFDKGFFRWRAYGTSGVFSVDCSSSDFATFQREIIQQHPATFEDFEGLLP